MEKSETAGADARSANRSVGPSLHQRPAGRKILIAVAIFGAIAGIVLNWGWLVALGIAPLILAVVPWSRWFGGGRSDSRSQGGSK